MKKIAALSLLLTLLCPVSASAWWNDAWTERRIVTIDTSASGADIATPLATVAVPVRLHSGNFNFAAAGQDGGDLRFVAGDDKTLLKHHIEHFDAANELALAWVLLPGVAPKTAGAKIYAYFGNPKAGPEGDAAGGYDADTSAVFHFREGEERPLDASANGNHARGPLAVEKAGLLAASGRFGGEVMTLAASPSLTFSAAGGFTFSAWLRLGEPSPKATLYRQGPVEVAVDGGKLFLAGAGGTISGGNLAPNAWHHLAVTVAAGQAALYVDGAQVAAGPAAFPDLQGEARIGEGLIGLMDEVQIARAARSADWVKAAALGQGSEGRLLNVAAENEEGASGGHSYFGILVENLTVDAWVVIGILMVMFVVAAGVMVAKTRMVGIMDKDNRRFLLRFRQASHDFLDLDQGGAHPHSSLYRLYQAGLREVKKRIDGKADVNLSGASINAIKASVDADMVRETHKLNDKMVLLTIAISGGPFLGLLGTVVGVMITFAAIAAAGDVNVNAIAPGIAAALLATVAGLAVAIPALFGYNYLASRIKNISADMQIFVDEFITRVAETYSR